MSTFTVAIVSFRETFEILLIIVPLLAYVVRMGRKDLSKYIYIGCLSGVIASIASAALIYSGVNGLSGSAQDIFEGSMSFFLCALIIYSIGWLGRQSKNYSQSIENKFNIKTTGIGLFLLSALTIFRECLELVLFTLPYAVSSKGDIYLGVLAGLLVTFILGILIYKTSIKLNISLIFSFITLFLIYIGSVMFGEGLEKFFPQYGQSIVTAGMMVFGIPLLFLFIKNEIKKFTKK